MPSSSQLEDQADGGSGEDARIQFQEVNYRLIEAPGADTEPYSPVSARCLSNPAIDTPTRETAVRVTSAGLIGALFR